MRSILSYFSAAALLAAGVAGSDAATADWPTVTPPPVPNALVEFELRRRATIDPASLADVLLTALPLSLQLLAATNLPSASHVIWSEFLDNNKPDWFTGLPDDIKSYLVQQYGPSTAWATSTTPTSLATSSSTASAGSAGSIVNAAPTSSSSAAPQHHGLSAGAKIGLGVGIPLGVLLIVAALLACCMLHRRRKQKQRRGSRPPTPGFIPTSTRHGHSTSTDRVARYPLRGGGSSAPLSADTSGWDSNGDRDSGLGGIGGPSYEHSLPPPAPPYHSHSANGSRGSRGSRTSLSSLHSVPEVPEHLHEHGYGGVPIPPPRSPRRRSLGGDPQYPPALVAGGERERRRSSGGPSPLNPAFGMSKAEEAHAESAGRHAHQLPPNHPGQGIYAGQRNPFADEHSSSEEDFVLAPEHAEMRQASYPYGRGWAHQVEGERAEMHTPANEWTHSEWPLRNDAYQHQQQYGRPMSQMYDRVYDGT